jgi:hypothetical protein
MVKCQCNDYIEVRGNQTIEFEKNFLSELSVDGYKWRTLYQCNYCDTFWEESYSDGRWNGEPILSKVEEEHILQVWNCDEPVAKKVEFELAKKVVLRELKAQQKEIPAEEKLNELTNFVINITYSTGGSWHHFIDYARATIK